MESIFGVLHIQRNIVVAHIDATHVMTNIASWLHLWHLLQDYQDVLIVVCSPRDC